MSNTEQLLTPRVIVQHLYPGCPFEVGTILTLEDNVNDHLFGKLYCAGKFFTKQRDIDRSIDSGCNAFRRLEWWQNRLPGDLPEYVKYVGAEVILDKVLKIHSPGTFENIFGALVKWDTVLPSTLQEYKDYMSQFNRKERHNEYLNKQSNG